MKEKKKNMKNEINLFDKRRGEKILIVGKYFEIEKNCLNKRKLFSRYIPCKINDNKGETLSVRYL